VLGESSHTYALQVGSRGMERLDLLAESHDEGTRSLLQDTLGPLTITSALDLGCGLGQVSKILAGFVGANGRVLGVDISAEQIAIARERYQHDQRIQFETGDVQQLEIRDELFDVVYSRFLLGHLDDKHHALEAMLGHLKPGGVIVAEVMDLRSFRCDPPDDSFTRFIELFDEHAKQLGLNHDGADRVQDDLRDHGISDVRVRELQCEWTTMRQKRQILLGLEESEPHWLATGLVSEVETERLSKALESLCVNEKIILFEGRTYQVTGRLN
jgi:ubiquinone/menaquinone biosynthesis C-methylase UbiE